MLGLILGGLSAAGSLLGGLGASSAAKSQQRRQAAYDEANKQFNINIASEMMRQVPQRLAGDAEIAGFNPQTWLQAGALGYYSNAFGMMRSDGATQAVNIPSALSAVGNAIGSFGQAYGQQARFDANLEFQESALGQNLKAMGQRAMSHPTATQMGAGGTSALGGAGVPMYTAGSVVSSRGLGGLSANATQVFDWLPVDKSAPDAQKVADRYGEGGENVAGAYNFVTDMSKKYTGMTLPEHAREAIGPNADLADFFSMDMRRNRKFFSEYFQPSTGPRVEWNNPFVNPNKGLPLPPGFGGESFATGGAW